MTPIGEQSIASVLLTSGFSLKSSHAYKENICEVLIILWCLKLIQPCFSYFMVANALNPCFSLFLFTSAIHNILSKPLAAFRHSNR